MNERSKNKKKYTLNQRRISRKKNSRIRLKTRKRSKKKGGKKSIHINEIDTGSCRPRKIFCSPTKVRFKIDGKDKCCKLKQGKHFSLRKSIIDTDPTQCDIFKDFLQSEGTFLNEQETKLIKIKSSLEEVFLFLENLLVQWNMNENGKKKKKNKEQIDQLRDQLIPQLIDLQTKLEDTFPAVIELITKTNERKSDFENRIEEFLTTVDNEDDNESDDDDGTGVGNLEIPEITAKLTSSSFNSEFLNYVLSDLNSAIQLSAKISFKTLLLTGDVKFILKFEKHDTLSINAIHKDEVKSTLLIKKIEDRYILDHNIKTFVDSILNKFSPSIKAKLLKLVNKYKGGNFKIEGDDIFFHKEDSKEKIVTFKKLEGYTFEIEDINLQE